VDAKPHQTAQAQILPKRTQKLQGGAPVFDS